MPKTDIRANPGRFALGCILGAAVTLLLTVPLLAVPSAMIAAGSVGEEGGVSLAAAAAFVASCAGAMTARIKNRGAALLSGVVSGLIAAATRMLVSLLSGSALDGGDLVICLAILAGGLITGAVRFGKRRRRR